MLIRLLVFSLCFFPTISLLGQQVHQKDSITHNFADTIVLDEVSISATNRAKISGMLSGNLKLHTSQLQSIPAISGTVDVLKLMELTPSVRTSGDGSSNMYVRGGDAGQNLIIYNGIASYTPGHMLGIFPLFNADHLSWVKMSKNGADSEYGNFISSVIDVKSKEEVSTSFWAKGNIGLLASQLTLAVPLSAEWGAYLSGRKTYLGLIVQPLIKNSLSKSSKEDSDIDYDFWDTNLTILGKINRKHSLAIDLMVGGDKLKIDDKEVLLDGSLKWQNILSSATVKLHLSDNLSLEQAISFSRFSNHLNTGQEQMVVKLNSKIEDITYKNRFSFSVSKLAFDIGLNYTQHSTMPHDLKLINSGVTTNSVLEDKIKAHDLSSFITTSWSPLDWLNFKSVFRYNVFMSKAESQRSFTNFHSPDIRLSGQYRLKNNLYLRTNYSHNNQYVNKLTPSSVGLPTDFWIIAADQIKPQRGDEFSLGWYYLFMNNQIELSADIYYRSMHNVTQFDYNFIANDNSSFINNVSYGRGRAYGLELMLKKNYGKLTGWLSYALSKSERKFDEINEAKWFPARFDRTHDLSLTSNYKFNSKWDLSLTCIYATGNTYTQPTSWYFINNLPIKEYTEYNNARMPDYSRVDIGINYWFKKNNGLNFSLYNMLMVENPIYIFMVIKQDSNDNIKLEMKRKKLYTIIPSISWNFKF